MAAPEPNVGRIVHYVSHGSPVRDDGTQAFASECRAAIVTAVEPIEPDEARFTSLCVLNPAGMFFKEDCQHDEGHRPFGKIDGLLCNGRDYRGGTWHWPPRA